MRTRLWISGIMGVLILSIMGSRAETSEKSFFTDNDYKEFYADLISPEFLFLQNGIPRNSMRYGDGSILNDISPDFYNNFENLLKSAEERSKYTRWLQFVSRIGLTLLNRTEHDIKKSFIYVPDNLTDYAYSKIYEWYQKNGKRLTLSRLRELWLYDLLEFDARWYCLDRLGARYRLKTDSLLTLIESEVRMGDSSGDGFVVNELSDDELNSLIDAECRLTAEGVYYNLRKQEKFVDFEITPEFLKNFRTYLETRQDSMKYIDAYYRSIVGELSMCFRLNRDNCDVWVKEFNGAPIPTECACRKMLEWYEAHGAALTIDRMRELLRLKREIDHADFKGTDPSKYYSGIDSLFNVMESESVVNVTD